jgi:hypothetical protein
MANSTPNFLFPTNDSTSHFNGEKVKPGRMFAPKKSTVKNILAFSKSLESLNTSSIGPTSYTLS